MMESGNLHIEVKCNGIVHSIDNLTANNTLLHLKEYLYSQTRVRPENQKLLGLKTKKGIEQNDETELGDFNLPTGKKIMLIGPTEEAIASVNLESVDASEVVDEFELTEASQTMSSMQVYLDKIENRCKTYKMKGLCQPRPNKRLLVLDIDYTIFDHLSTAQTASQLARPHLMEFLKRAYEFYDIAIWSATSMTWILAKLGQIGVLNSQEVVAVKQLMVEQNSGKKVTQVACPSECPPAAGFRVFALVDSGAMISVHFEERGVKEVKPLAVIWHHFPQFGPHNTIMFDDVKRNFVMNPQSGLRISPYRDALQNWDTDRELLHLAEYLEFIAMLEDDFSSLEHKYWSRYVEKAKRKQNRAAKESSSPSDEKRLKQDST